LKTYNLSTSGYVLPIVLFLVIILTGGGVFALHIAKQEIANTADLFDTAEAELEAESQLEIVKFYAASGHFTLHYIENTALLNGPVTYPEKLYIDGRDQNVTKTLAVRLQDTAGMLNAMYPDAQAITDLLAVDGDFGYSDTIRDSIADWFDKDDLHRLNGAEEAYYQQRKFPFSPRNVPISLYRDELRLIHGLHELTNEQWDYVNRFLILSPVSAFNYTTAPPELLAAKLHVSVKELAGLTDLREKDIYLFLNRIREIGTGYNPETTNTFPSGVIAVEILSQRNNAQVTLHAILDCNDYDDAPVHTISRY
jgi:hypothetical protein